MLETFYRSAKDIYRKNKPYFSQGPMKLVVGHCIRLRNAYRVRKQRSRNRGLLRKRFQSILTTLPLSCNSSAAVELHTTTSHSHLLMYITAVKSLLRFYDDISIVVHDDGSFTEDDRRLVSDHILGIKIIDKSKADNVITGKLASFPLCRTFRRKVVNAMELFDNILLSETEKIISMNSDILFLEKPETLITWLKSDTKEIMSVYEENPSHQSDFLRKFACSIPPHITLCLVAFYGGVFDASLTENVLEHSGFDWYTAQNVYPLLFCKSENRMPLSFFNKTDYQSSGDFPAGAVFRHYWTSTGFFNDIQFKDADRVIAELSKGADCFV